MKKQFGGAAISFTLSFAVVAGAAAFVAIWFVMPDGIGQQIQSSCHVNGLGQGSCSFTNSGWTPGTACTEVTLTNTTGSKKTASSDKFCSGRVWPNDTIEKDFTIVLGDTCKDDENPLKSWNDICSMNVIDRTR